MFLIGPVFILNTTTLVMMMGCQTKDRAGGHGDTPPREKEDKRLAFGDFDGEPPPAYSPSSPYNHQTIIINAEEKRKRSTRKTRLAMFVSSLAILAMIAAAVCFVFVCPKHGVEEKTLGGDLLDINFAKASDGLSSREVESAPANFVSSEDELKRLARTFLPKQQLAPFCLHGEDNNDGNNLGEDGKGSCFNGIDFPTLSSSKSAAIDDSVARCKGWSSFSVPSLVHVYDNYRFFSKKDTNINMTTCTFYNYDTLLFDTVVKGRFSIPGDIPLEHSEMAILERAIYSGFADESKDRPAHILRFRYSLEKTEFALQKSGNLGGDYDQGISGLSLGLLGRLQDIDDDEREYGQLVDEYGTHIMVNGTLGSHFDIIMELDLAKSRDPYDKDYYETMSFCLGSQFEEIGASLDDNYRGNKSSLFSGVNFPLLQAFPKCLPLLRLYSRSDLLFPINLKKIRMALGSDNPEAIPLAKRVNSQDCYLFSSVQLREALAVWRALSWRQPKITSAHLAPIYSLVHPEKMLFQEQFFISGKRHSFGSFSSHAEMLGKFDELLSGKQISRETPVDVKRKTGAKYDLLKKSVLKRLTRENSNVPAGTVNFPLEKQKLPLSSLHLVPTLESFAMVNYFDYKSIKNEKVSSLEPWLGIRNIYVKVSLKREHRLNPKLSFIVHSQESSVGDGSILDWSLYPFKDEKSLFNFEDPEKRPLLTGHHIVSSKSHLLMDSLVERRFALLAQSFRAADGASDKNGGADESIWKRRLPIGLDGNFQSSTDANSIAEDTDPIIPLDERTSSSRNNPDHPPSTADKKLPIVTDGVVVTFAPPDYRLFDYMSRYENYTDDGRLDTAPPLSMSDISFKAPNTKMLYSLKKGLSHRLTFSPDSIFLNGGAMCPAVGNTAQAANHQYHKFEITQDEAAYTHQCFSLTADVPPGRILSASCKKNTIRESNDEWNHRLAVDDDKTDLLAHITFRIALAYIKEEPRRAPGPTHPQIL